MVALLENHYSADPWPHIVTQLSDDAGQAAMGTRYIDQANELMGELLDTGYGVVKSNTILTDRGTSKRWQMFRDFHGGPSKSRNYRGTIPFGELVPENDVWQKFWVNGFRNNLLSNIWPIFYPKHKLTLYPQQSAWSTQRVQERQNNMLVSLTWQKDNFFFGGTSGVVAHGTVIAPEHENYPPYSTEPDHTLLTKYVFGGSKISSAQPEFTFMQGFNRVRFFLQLMESVDGVDVVRKEYEMPSTGFTFTFQGQQAKYKIRPVARTEFAIDNGLESIVEHDVMFLKIGIHDKRILFR